MVNLSLSSRFSFISSSTSSTPSSSTISSRSRINPPRPSSPPPKSPPTTAISILGDLSNCSDPFPLTRRPAKRPKTSDGSSTFTSFSDLLSIPPSVLNREMEQSEREREQQQQQEGKEFETAWTAPPTPDPYFLAYRPSSRGNNHNRSLSDPSPTLSTFEEAASVKVSPTRPSFNRTQTDPGYGSSSSSGGSHGGSRRSSTGSPQRFKSV